MKIDREVLRKGMADVGLPDYMWDGLTEYIMKGRSTGGFLTAIFTNDLKEACNLADGTNLPIIHKYVYFLYNWAPGGCWGSKANVERWYEVGGYEGIMTPGAKVKR